MELHDLALRRQLADREVAAGLVDAHDVADEEVAHRRGLVQPIHGDAQEEGVARQVPVALVQSAHDVDERLHGALAVQLQEPVLGAGGDLHGLADRTASLCDDRVYGDGARHCYADGSGRLDVAADVEGVAAPRVRAAGQAAYRGAPGVGVVEAGDQPVGREAERVGEQDEVGLAVRMAVDELPPPLRRGVLVGQVVVLDVEQRQLGLGQRCRGERESGAALHLSARADDAASRAPQQGAVTKLAAHQSRYLIVGGRVGRGGKHEREIGTRTFESLHHACGALLDGPLHGGVVGYGGAPLHATALRSTTTRPPPRPPARSPARAAPPSSWGASPAWTSRRAP